MTHKKPAPSKPVTVAKLWGEMFTDANRPTWPAWICDFISVHQNTVAKPGDKPTYSMIAPMCYVMARNGDRPEWETARHPTKREAMTEAARLAREHGYYVVDCTQPRYL